MSAQSVSDADQARLTYEEMAPYYDAFSAHHDHKAWCESLLPILDRHGLSGSRLLDLGCGTGKSFLPLLEAGGWQITACDLSPAMLSVAAGKTNGDVRLEVADLRALPVFGQFDLVWSLGDVVNYMLKPGQLEDCLAGMGANLAERGLLLFDPNTIRTYRTWYGQTHVMERDGLRLIWRGRASAAFQAGDEAEAVFEVERLEEETGRPLRSSTHRQRHFPPEVIVAALEEGGLECRGVYGQGLDGVLEEPLDEERHTKAIFIASRAQKDS